jgi:hypothetical protein
MAVRLPEGDLQSRLERYLEGLRNSHGLEDSAVEGNVVRVVVDPESVPAVLATAREALGVLHLSFITVVDRVGSFELTYELLDYRGGHVRVRRSSRVRSRSCRPSPGFTRRPTGTSGRPTTCSGLSSGDTRTCGGSTCGRITSIITRS